jgi:hypothetical protein
MKKVHTLSQGRLMREMRADSTEHASSTETSPKAKTKAYLSD